MKFSHSLALSAIVVSMSMTVNADDKKEVGNAMQLGDDTMSCEALIAEAQAMQDVIGGAPEGALLGSAMADSMATEAAMRAGGSGVVGGKIGGAFKAFGKKKKKKAEENKARASSRWFYIVGLYQGQQCGKPKPAMPAATGENMGNE